MATRSSLLSTNEKIESLPKNRLQLFCLFIWLQFFFYCDRSELRYLHDFKNDSSQDQH